MNSVPKSLQVWFVIHFALDLVIAIPLIFFTEWFLFTISFPAENILAAKLVGAALFGIGSTSLIMHKGGVEAYRTMLILKLIWSGSAILAIILVILDQPNTITWLALGIFTVFFIVWAFYFRMVNRLM